MAVFFTFIILDPVYLQAEPNMDKPYKLIKTTEDIHTEEFIIKKGTYLYAKPLDKDHVSINFNNRKISILKDKVVYLTDEDLEMFYVPEYINEEGLEKEDNYKFVSELYGFPHEDIAIKFINTDKEVPVYKLDGEVEVVIMGNVMFYVNKEDYENMKRTADIPKERVNEKNNKKESSFKTKEDDKDIERTLDNKKLLNDYNKMVRENESDKEKRFNLSVANSDPWKGQNKGYFKIKSDAATVYDIRSGNYVEVGKLVKGQVYPRVGQSGRYHKIRFGNYYAYVHMGHTEWSDGSGIKNENTKYKNTARVFTATEDIPVYDNSSGSFVTFGIIKKGTKFAIATNSGTEFWRVIYADRVGFVYKSRTKVDFQNNDKYFKVISDAATVYDIRSGNYVEVGKLVKGQVYPRVGQSGRYHKIRFGNYYAYVHMGHTEWSDGSGIKNENTKYKNTARVFTATEDIPVYDNSSGSFVTFGIIKKGTKFAIATNSGTEFWRVIYADRVGFVYKSRTKAEFLNSDKFFQAINKSPVYDIRTGKYIKVAELIPGEVYPRLGMSGNYHKIRLGDFFGFVHKSHTVLGDGSKIKNISKNDRNSSKKISVEQVAPVYDNTSGSFVQFGSLMEGTTYTIVDEGKNYVKIIFADRIGYVNKKHLSSGGVKYSNYNLSLDEALQIQMKVVPQTDKKYAWVSKDYIQNNRVNATSLNVRTGPGTKYGIVGRLSNGSTVKIIDEYSGWYAIEFSHSLQWVHATPDEVRYYLNPENFVDNARQRFQFLDLSKPSGVSKTVLNNFLRGKGILENTGQAFIDASNLHSINDIYLVSHAILETGNGTSRLAKGVEVGKNNKGNPEMVTTNNRKNLRDIKTVYNMFGIGAKDGCAIKCGSEKAYKEGWTTPYKAIVGGAKFIGNDYIKAGQNTLYKMRWNPALMEKGYAGHQYATDVGWAFKQVNTMYNLYQQLGINTLYLDIPVYKK